MPISSPVSSVLSLLTKSNRQTIVKARHLSKKNNMGTKPPASRWPTDTYNQLLPIPIIS